MCAVEEAARQDLKIKTPRTFSIKQQLMAYCEKCKLTEQNIVSNPEITKVEGCDNLTYFEIMHLQLKNTFGTITMIMVLEDDNCGNITHYI